MKHNFCALYDDIKLRPLHRNDIEYLRQWRNRADLNRYLRRLEEISTEMQEKWYCDYLQDTDTAFFVMEYQGIQTVGSIALYGFCESRCEIGKIMIGEDHLRGQGLGRVMMLMAIQIGITFFGISEFSLCVHEDNIPARKTYERIGFRRRGEHPFISGGTELDMVLTSEELLAGELAEMKIHTYQEKQRHTKTRECLQN